MSQTVAKFGWLVYAFALMTNHFHWFFRTPDPNLCRGIQYLLGQYAARFNRRHGRCGHLFQGRFRCKVIENETYHWSVSRYVHLNPTPALAAHPAQWPWSSYPGFCDPSLRLPWVRYDDVLAAWQGAFGGDAAVGYREFVEAGLASPVPSPFDQAANGWILGSDAFVERIRGAISPDSNEPSSLAARFLPPRTLQQVIEATCEVCDVSPEQLRVRYGRNLARPIVAYLGQRLSSAKLADLAEVLGLGRRDSVPNLIRRAQQAPPHSPLRVRLERVTQRLGQNDV
jgi:REP element-mobilizing transposase RayT